MADLIQYVKDQRELFVSSCTDPIPFEKESQYAIQALQNNDFLYKTAANNIGSLQNAIINIAAIGISLNPASQHAYLVPRDGKVCLDISYRGLLHIAISSGSIKWGQCKLVHENDSYKSMGLDKAPKHEYSPFGERGAVVGGFCTVKTAEGDYLTEEMPVAEIIKIQNLSKAKNGPWSNHWEEMARKTIVKRASKYWPKVERLNTAIDYLNNEAGEGYESLEDSTLPDKWVSEIEDLEEILNVSNSCKAFNKNSVEDLTIDEANKIIDRLRETRGLMEHVTTVKQAIAKKDWITAHDTLHSLTDKEKQLLWVAPSKGGVFTTEERRIIKEELRSRYDEACEEALDMGIINEEGTKL